MPQLARLVVDCDFEERWTVGDTGWAEYDRNDVIVANVNPDFDGIHARNIPGLLQVFGADMEHVRATGRPLTMGRFWLGIVWRVSWTPLADGGLRAEWECVEKFREADFISFDHLYDAVKRLSESRSAACQRRSHRPRPEARPAPGGCRTLSLAPRTH